MKIWRAQLAVAILALSCSTGSAQSLGDVARSERERRARMAQHAPMLTDDDLRREQILKKTPSYSDSALPSPDTTSTSVDENLPLGDYARALRRRRLAEPAPPENAVATGPAPEPQPAAAAIIAPEQQPAVAAAGQKATSLGDLAREVRAEREAARRVRIQQKAAQQIAPQPAVKASKDAVRADKTVRAPKAAHPVQAAAKTAPTPQPARSVQAADKAARVVKTASQTATAHTAQAVNKTVRAPQPARSVPAVNKTAHVLQTASQTARTVPAAATSVKPAQLTTVSAKPSVQPIPQPRAALEPDAAGEQSIRVPRGASLWKLARTYLGSGNLWTALWKANPQIHDPNRIRAGQTLRLPDLDDKDNPSSNGL